MLSLLRRVYELVLLVPARLAYRSVVWNGQSADTVCASLTNYEPAFWARESNIVDCRLLIDNRINSMLIGALFILYIYGLTRLSLHALSHIVSTTTAAYHRHTARDQRKRTDSTD